MWRKDTVRLVGSRLLLLILCALGCISPTIFWAQTNVLDSTGFHFNLDSSRGSLEWVSYLPGIHKKSPQKKIKEKLQWLIMGNTQNFLKKPIAAVPDTKGGYWILDQESCKVYYYSSEGELGEPRYIQKQHLNLSSLVSICPFKDGTFLVIDAHLNTVFLLNPIDKTFQPINETLKINHPTGIVYDPFTDQIYVSETGKHRILAMNARGTVIDSIGHRGKGIGEFNFPT